LANFTVIAAKHYIPNIFRWIDQVTGIFLEEHLAIIARYCITYAMLCPTLIYGPHTRLKQPEKYRDAAIIKQKTF